MFLLLYNSLQKHGFVKQTKSFVENQKIFLKSYILYMIKWCNLDTYYRETPAVAG